MSTVYERAPNDIEKRGKRIIEKFHSALAACAATVDYAFAYNDEGPAVTVNGYPCDAKVKVVSLKDRALGRADAEIVIDANRWGAFSDAEQDALLDHELQHLEVRTNSKGVIQRDDCGRPKLNLRKHDWQMGFFDAVARRHGEASCEVRSARQFLREVGSVYLQGEFNFVDVAATADESEQAAQAVRSAHGKGVLIYDHGKKRVMATAKEAADLIVGGCKKELQRQREAGE